MLSQMSTSHYESEETLLNYLTLLLLSFHSFNLDIKSHCLCHHFILFSTLPRQTHFYLIYLPPCNRPLVFYIPAIVILKLMGKTDGTL